MEINISDPICFVGGVHGAGKSHFCVALSDKLNGVHLVASELIRFSPEASDTTGKLVKNMAGNQMRLVTALRQRESIGKPIFLDGHYCLLMSDGTIGQVPIATFAAISPSVMILVDASAAVIHERLSKRDGKSIDIAVIDRLLHAERMHFMSIGNELNIPYFVTTPSTSQNDVTTNIAAYIHNS